RTGNPTRLDSVGPSHLPEGAALSRVYLQILSHRRFAIRLRAEFDWQSRGPSLFANRASNVRWRVARAKVKREQIRAPKESRPEQRVFHCPGGAPYQMRLSADISPGRQSVNLSSRPGLRARTTSGRRRIARLSRDLSPRLGSARLGPASASSSSPSAGHDDARAERRVNYSPAARFLYSKHSLVRAERFGASCTGNQRASPPAARSANEGRLN
ncbi:Hypothetical predicted protein, partial [Olea europaea subsp. europaea]